ncbi:hypothetical protein DXG01_004031 [Tephrocybe rancida]|nr:hypothetical protein DXG01_004031 [Tephrocybe rancida]
MREIRAILVLNTKRHKPLWEAGSAEDFKKVFIDCVECFPGGYFLCNLPRNENNMVFETTADGTKKGIMNDWDLAPVVDENAATHRTGTAPFVSKDLLVATPPPHVYRHDLESFFYILVWAAVHHDFLAKTRMPTVPALVHWASEDFETVLESKSYFTEISHCETVLSTVIPDSTTLLPWIESLWNMFSDAFQMTQTIKRKKKSHPGSEFPDWDNATLGDKLPFSHL